MAGGDGRASRHRLSWGRSCRSSMLGRPAVPCGRKEAQLPLIMFLFLPPARMRGDCRFRRLQVTAGDLVVLPLRGPEAAAAPAVPRHRAGVEGLLPAAGSVVPVPQPRQPSC